MEPEDNVAGPYRLLLTICKRGTAGWTQPLGYLAEGLQARGHTVYLACPADSAIVDRVHGSDVTVIPFDFDWGWSRRSARALAKLSRDYGIDLIDAQESRDRKAAILARIFYRNPAKLVITRRQMSESFPLENFIYAAAADRIVAVSDGVARSLVRGGMPRRKVTVVREGLDPRRLTVEVSDTELARLRGELGIDPDLPVIGVVARRKDQETLLRALGRAGRAVNVLFIGIDRDDALAKLEVDLPAGSNVIYAGFRERIAPFYRLLDIKVLTTRAEGLPQVLMESMGFGVPVISAAAGGTPEIVEDGENGLLYPPGDAVALAARILRLLDNGNLRARFIEEGQKTVKSAFHADETVRRVEAVYHRLLKDRYVIEGNQP